MIIWPGFPFNQILSLLASAILSVVNDGFHFPFLFFIIIRQFRKFSGGVQVRFLTLLCHILFKEGNMESWMQTIIHTWQFQLICRLSDAFKHLKWTYEFWLKLSCLKFNVFR